MKIHDLKTHKEFFDVIVLGYKNFEVRKNDRDFKVGDQLLLREVTLPKGHYCNPIPDTEPTGRILHRRISYVLPGGQFGIEAGTVVLGLKKI